MLMGLSRRNILKYKYRSMARRIYFFIVFLLALSLSFMFMLRLRSAFLRVMTSHAINIGSDAINMTVADYFEDHKYTYGDFVTLSHNNDDEITSVQTNTSLMNKVKADLSLYLQEYVNELKTGIVSIPFGNIFNNPVLSGIGPDLKIKIKPTDITDLNFCDSFESAGINQVRHKIYIEAIVTISIHCASMSKTEVITDTIPVAETVVVGRVPEYYGTNGVIQIPESTKEE